MNKRIYIICPVRQINKKQQEFISSYVEHLEKIGCNVHLPYRDADQTDDGLGLGILEQHREAMLSCDEVHIYFDPNSAGSLFDFGMAFVLKKKIRLFNKISKTEHKSFDNVLLELERREHMKDICQPDIEY